MVIIILCEDQYKLSSYFNLDLGIRGVSVGGRYSLSHSASS